MSSGIPMFVKVDSSGNICAYRTKVKTAPVKPQVRNQQRLRISRDDMDLPKRTSADASPLYAINLPPRSGSAEALRSQKSLRPKELRERAEQHEELQKEFQEMLDSDFARREDPTAIRRYTKNAAAKYIEKNRHTNVHPYDRTVVRLPQLNGDLSTTYINASWVGDGLRGTHMRYICAQGPLPGTIDDFWRMAWETKTTNIVMLTREVEANRVKVERYWPKLSEKRVVYGVMAVTALGSPHSNGGLDVTQFKVENTNTPNECAITVRHILYGGWPDHDVPKSTEGVLSILEMLENEAVGASGSLPVIVHCSAGIGRTGTFVLVHTALQKYLSSKKSPKKVKVSIFDLLLRLREDRAGLVQTPAQYEFAYRAIVNGLPRFAILRRDAAAKKAEALKNKESLVD